VEDEDAGSSKLAEIEFLRQSGDPTIVFEVRVLDGTDLKIGDLRYGTRF